MDIRHASPEHLPGITEIYNDAVAHTTAIWNDKLVDVDNRQQWLQQRRAAGYPVLVAIDDAGAVAGYASFGDFRAFDGYRFTVEHSVYVHREQRRRGVARQLLAQLIDEARTIGKHVMVAAIEAENKPSIDLHTALGFVHAGRMAEVGTKFGRWLDLVWMQRTLQR
jgi:phosphinothricin acetyltransferase